MANQNLINAKNAKSDEFYTQYDDIQKEMQAYLDYDPDVFRGKVVYCNCDDPYESNFFRYFALKFNEIGLKQLITTSYKTSPVACTQLDLFGEGSVDANQNDRPVGAAARFIINEVGDTNDDGAFNLTDIADQLRANKNNEWSLLKGDGDFRSAECIELLKQADIVITNPPFSLYREYVAQLVEYDKKYVIIGNKNSITNKEIFPLIKDNKMWVGSSSFSKDILFIAPEGTDLSDKPATALREVDGVIYLRSPSVWFTNLDHGRRHHPLSLMTMADNLKFNKKMNGKTKYDRYVNYDAIEVPFTDAIPSDYDGEMGVPISFLDKYSPEQFEIIGISLFLGKPMSDIAEKGTYQQGGPQFYIANGDGTYRRMYDRIVIKPRKADK